MSPQIDAVIKTTARIQEAHEPPRQKPIIKLDARHALVNGADRGRASIDSGRDNPFRPDGEIYKLTNPIVDYYKFGPNQSRTATPTYAELDYFSSKNKRKRRAASKKAGGASDAASRPCWRRWLCCCCPPCSCFRATRKPDGERDGKSEREQPDEFRSSPAGGFPSEPRQDGDTVRIIEAGERVAPDLKQAPGDGSGGGGGGGKRTTTKSETTRNKSKQKTKRVVLDEDGLLHQARGPAASSDQDGGRGPRPARHDESAGLGATQVKTVERSRCVIS